MLASLLVCLTPQNPPPPSLSTIDIPLLQNSAFGSIAGVQGAHWCGAEGSVTQGAPNYVSLVPGKRVFQAAAKAQHQATPAAISLQVRPQVASDVGLCTISEGSKEGAAMIWQLITGDTAPTPWTAYEQLQNGNWVQMDFDLAGDIPHWAFLSTQQTQNRVDVIETDLATSVELWFDCSTADNVVCMVRPILAEGTTGDVTVTVLKDPDGFGGTAATVIGSYQLAPNLPEGRDLLLSTFARASDHLVFRAKNENPGTVAHLVWRPMIRVEQPRITYAFTQNGTVPTGGPEEGVVTVPTTPASWNTWTLEFEANFFTRFNRAPVAPYTIELKGHSGTVDFTNVQCVQNRTAKGYGELRATVLTETDRIIDEYQGTRDNLETPTKWQLYKMDPQEGPKPIITPQGVRILNGSMPSNIRRLLDVTFWEREYDDYMAIVGAKFDPTNRHPNTRLYWPTYHCEDDAFVQTTPGQTTGSADGGLALEAYRRTGDASLLEIARDYAMVMAENGVISATLPNTPGVPDNRNGLVLEGGYRVEDEVNPQKTAPGAELEPWGALGGAAFLVEVAAELRAYQAAHSGQTELVAEPLLESVARVAIEKALLLKIFSSSWAANEWSGPWYVFAYQFSDIYAYNANAAISAADAIAPFAQASQDTQAIRDALVEYVRGGAVDYLERWKINAARTAINSADQARAWPPYAWLIEKNLGLTPTQTSDARAQLLRVARRLAAYALPDGVWVNANEEEFYMEDLAGGGGTVGLAAPTIGAAFSQVIRADAGNAALRDELFTRACDMFGRTLTFFAQDPNYPHGYVPDYFCSGQPSCASKSIQAETRMLDNYLDALTTLDRVYHMGQAGELPVLGIAPRDYSAAPPSGVPEFFTMTVTAPLGENIVTLLNSRLRIRLHQRTGSGPFVPTSIWPGNPGDWQVQLNGQTATLLFLQPQFAPKEFKFELLAWTGDGRWDRTTSLQRW